jgi:hypothetical protein
VRAQAVVVAGKTTRNVLAQSVIVIGSTVGRSDWARMTVVVDLILNLAVLERAELQVLVPAFVEHVLEPQHQTPNSLALGSESERQTDQERVVDVVNSASPR